MAGFKQRTVTQCGGLPFQQLSRNNYIAELKLPKKWDENTTQVTDQSLGYQMVFIFISANSDL